MRFLRQRRYGDYEDTSRKRAGVLRKQKAEREALPLFASEIAETQKSVDDIMSERAQKWDVWMQDMRDRRARKWREARAAVAALGGNLGPVVLAAWNSDCPYPADPGYLLVFIHQVECGRVDPSSPPWRISPQEIAAGQARLAASYVARKARQEVAA